MDGWNASADCGDDPAAKDSENIRVAISHAFTVHLYQQCFPFCNS
jgi:hypothetical protein